jgi:antirestriction protein ArdC
MQVSKIVTDQVIKGLEQGKVPWQKPWLITPPQNFLAERRYTGINILLAALACEDNSFKYPLFATFNQIKHANGFVKSGSKGNLIVFTKRITRETHRQDEDGQDIIEERAIPFLRYYHVFNIEQTSFDVDDYVKRFEHNNSHSADSLLTRKHPKIITGQRACYSPLSDTITLPDIETFTHRNEYYLTGYHELTHWTGHKTRLDRLATTHFGSGDYSLEELVAEIGANMLSLEAGITRHVIKNSQAYINNWLDRLHNDSKFIIQAASKAQKAFDYVTE